MNYWTFFASNYPDLEAFSNELLINLQQSYPNRLDIDRVRIHPDQRKSQGTLTHQRSVTESWVHR